MAAVHQTRTDHMYDSGRHCTDGSEMVKLTWTRFLNMLIWTMERSNGTGIIGTRSVSYGWHHYILHSFETTKTWFASGCSWTSVLVWSTDAHPRVSQTIEMNKSIRTISVSSNINTVVLVGTIVHHGRLYKHMLFIGRVCVCDWCDQFGVFIIDIP